MTSSRHLLLLLLCCSACTQAAISYEVLDQDSGGKMLSVTDDAADKTYSGPEEQYVDIIGVQDFNGDGVEDALVSAWNGGSCCAPEFSVVSVVDGTLIVAAIEAEAYELTIEEEGGRYYIRDTEPELAQIFAFDGTRVTLRRRIDKLAALAEVHGPGGLYIDEVPPVDLVFDVDDDGDVDTIACAVWTRWGSLLCDMPLPGGGTQSAHTGCARVGVLKSVNNGYHEFVCDFGTVITFDGKQWVEKSDPKGRVF